MSFNNNCFNNNTVGPNGAAIRHGAARTALHQQADHLLRGAVGPVVQGLAPIAGIVPGQATLPNPLSYEEVMIFDPIVANYLSQIFCFTSEEIARAADFPIRAPGSSPYDSPNTPVIARRNHIRAASLLSQRQSYIKALLIHSRGNLNVQPCQRCRDAYNRTGEFLHYAGCISLFSWWGGACSNCVHDDHGASCSLGGGDNRKLSYDNYSKHFSKRRSESPDANDGKGRRGARRLNYITGAGSA